MRSTLIILASIGSLVASSAAFAAAPYASTAAPAVVKHQFVKKVSSTAPVKAIHKNLKKVHKVAMTHKKHRKPAVAQATTALPAKTY